MSFPDMDTTGDVMSGLDFDPSWMSAGDNMDWVSRTFLYFHVILTKLT